MTWRWDAKWRHRQSKLSNRRKTNNFRGHTREIRGGLGLASPLKGGGGSQAGFSHSSEQAATEPSTVIREAQ